MRFGQNKNVSDTANARPLYAPAYVDNTLSSSQIEAVTAWAEEAGMEPAKIGSGFSGVRDNHTRRASVAWLHPENLPQGAAEIFERSILAANNDGFNFELTGMEALQFTVYDSANAGEYKWHVDTAAIGDGSIRKLSVSILLSDPSEFEGGKLLLCPDGNTTVAEERKGRAIFFPSWIPHCVTPVTRGIRKSLVIWAHGPAFK